jgi:multidrug resistance efflux pump
MQNPEKPLSEIDKLQKQIEQKKALLAKKKSQLAEKQRKEARANETRRKILAGAVVLQRAQTDPEFAALLFRLIGESMTEQRNRDLFPEIS